MFERFTDKARRAVVNGQEEARLLNHNYIGTEHILLGLVHDGEGVAARGLESLGIDLDSVRAKVIEIIGRGAETPHGHVPFTPRAKKGLELALREALQLGHNHIGTEHILLGLIREGEGVAAQVLQELGAELPKVRRAVIQLLAGSSGEATGGQGRPPGLPVEDVLLSEGLIAHGGSPGLPGFFGVVNGTPLGVVGALGSLIVLVALVALLVDRPLSGLADAGLVSLITGVVGLTVGVGVDLLSAAPGIRGERTVRWSAVLALAFLAAGAILIALDALLA